MKKFWVGFFIVAVCMVGAMACSAQMYENEVFGVSFSLSDNWTQAAFEGGVAYVHNESGIREESISFECVDMEGAFNMEVVDDSVLLEFCEEMYSDWALAESLREQNDAFVTVKTNYLDTRHETHNGIDFFRYEKMYTASAFGYHDAVFYEILYTTAYNNKMYFFTYSRPTEDNHFDDINAMLNSVVLDRISITINGEFIYPDSDPYILSGRTLVPIRAVAEKMGYSVSWDAENEIVTLLSLSDDTILHFGIGESVALKNMEEEIPLEVPALIVGSRTYLPLRAVAEAMEANVDWNSAERQVIIQK